MTGRPTFTGVLIGVLICGMAGTARPALASPASGEGSLARMNYAGLADSAVLTLEQHYYAGGGSWNMCVPAICARKNVDWGADSLTYALYFRWQMTRDPAIRPIMTDLASTAHLYTAADAEWSDIPEWDAVADIREYEVTRNPDALMKAEAAFAVVDQVNSAGFAQGACPAIDYQRANGGTNHLKTLETDSNYIKAALLLYRATGAPSYLAKARRKYRAVRTYFLSSGSSLYTAYVNDEGGQCVQVPGQFFASVNGNMIWAGVALAEATRSPHYLLQASATARAVARYLCDGTGVFTDLQTENDIVEPLVEGMYSLAVAGHQAFARDWLLSAASAAAAARTPIGTYGRFFNGPPPQGPVTAWQGNGGIAVMIAAARLDPKGVPADPWYWRQAVYVPDDRSLPAGIHGAVRITFSGIALAIIGKLGERRRMPGHARVLIGGEPLFNQVGIWQGEWSGERGLTGTILFAWRWPKPGVHRVTILPAANHGPGSTFFHMAGYEVVR